MNDIQKEIFDRYFCGDYICQISTELDIPMTEVKAHIDDFRQLIYPYDTYEEWAFVQEYYTNL